MLQLGPDPTAPYLSKSEQSIWSPKSTSSTMVIDAHKIYTFIGAKYYHQKSRKSLTFAISRCICQIWSTRALSTQLNWGTNATHMNNCEDAIICSGLLLSCISWRICWGLVQSFCHMTDTTTSKAPTRLTTFNNIKWINITNAIAWGTSGSLLANLVHFP